MIFYFLYCHLDGCNFIELQWPKSNVFYPDSASLLNHNRATLNDMLNYMGITIKYITNKIT